MTLYQVLKRASVNQKTAELLREVGFGEPCFAYWFKDSFTEGKFQNEQTKFLSTTTSNAAPLINQARDWLCKTYNLTFSWYITDKNCYNYFIFINRKIAAKGSLPFLENHQTEQMACLHAVMIVKDVLIITNPLNKPPW